MIIDNQKKTIKVTSMGKSIELPFDIIDKLAWAFNHEKDFVVMVIDARKAELINDTDVCINKKANHMLYSVDYLSEMHMDNMIKLGIDDIPHRID